MGGPNPDRWPTSAWCRKARTVGDMQRAGWKVISFCSTCRLAMPVDLRVIIRLSGPGAVLWNRQAKCRRIGCDGVVEFQGKPRELFQPMPLRTQWE
jgi:hypothetical protein